MADEKPKIISVLPGPATEGRKVGIWDVDKAHPGGEAWVAPGADSDKEPKPVEVAETGAERRSRAVPRLPRMSSEA
jgi:hypothetical protein